MDDAELVTRLRAGDTTAFRAIITAYYPSLYASALSYLDSEIAAEELIDGILARVWDRRSSMVLHSSLAAYLFAAVRNGAINMLKKEHFAEHRRQVLQATDEYPGLGATPDNPEEHVQHEEVQTTLWRVIDALPERMRAILTLRWREQLEWAEIAVAMEMSSAAVQMQHSRALKILRERLPRYFVEQ